MKILVGTDFNELATAALRVASELASEVVVVYADPFEPPVEFTAAQIPGLAAQAQQSRKRALDELERYAVANVRPGVSWRAQVVQATPVAGIVAVATVEKPDLIAIGTHGHGNFPRLVSGSVAKSLIRASGLPLLVVRSADVRAADVIAAIRGGEAGPGFDLFLRGREVEVPLVV